MNTRHKITVNEGTSHVYGCDLVDENGDPVSAAILDSLRCTLYDLVTDEVINLREDQNVLDVNGGGYHDTQALVGATVSGSAVITGLSSTADMVEGQSVTGTGIPSGAVIESIDSSSQVTLSKAATASGTPTLTFRARFQMAFTPADAVIVTTTESREKHIALFEAAWGSGHGGCDWEIEIKVINLHRVP